MKVKVGDYVKINYQEYRPDAYFKIIYKDSEYSYVIDVSDDRTIGWQIPRSTQKKWNTKAIKGWNINLENIIKIKKQEFELE